jgi:hypothetical protein
MTGMNHWHPVYFYFLKASPGCTEYRKIDGSRAQWKQRLSEQLRLSHRWEGQPIGLADDELDAGEERK